MNRQPSPSIFQRLRQFFIGKGRNLHDEQIFHRLTLVAFFAWIGLGSDGLSSSCYGPDEAYRTLGNYHSLAIFVAIGIVLTIMIISTSYSQIIRLFPSGGGGYRVATKLLSPKLGMISGCSLLVDYVLTIAVSIASGTDAIFSLLPHEYQPYKILVATTGILLLILLNLRGVKESVFSLMPVFILFIVTHAAAILFVIIGHAHEVPTVYHDALVNYKMAKQSLGTMGVLALVLRAYSMGAGTYTGLEAVSNSIPILKDPKVKTGLLTMRYMGISLAVTVFGLLLAYSVFKLSPVPGKTMNAVLLEALTAKWGGSLGLTFVFITLLSESVLLFIAAQTGFLDGPRVIGSMAQDSWFPRKFTVLSDRLVTQNGILFMGILALLILWITGGAVAILIVLYSINVFITFALSQSGMVRHWWQVRKSDTHWWHRFLVNGIGLIITVFILASVVTTKFMEGGWVTLVITSTLILAVSLIRRHYNYADKLVRRLNTKMFHRIDEIYSNTPDFSVLSDVFSTDQKTAVICVSGFNGLGICTYLKVNKDFSEYKNVVFLGVGIVDAGNFRGSTELHDLEEKLKGELEQYQKLARHFGQHAEIKYSIGTDVADEIKEEAKAIQLRFPDSVFFVGQFLLPKATALQRLLHNQTQFAIQNRLSHKGIIMVMIPIRSHLHVEMTR
ncbi:MAG: APC family permease [Bacteroidales bacterium]